MNKVGLSMVALVGLSFAMSACHPPESTFGLALAYENPDGMKGNVCSLAGNAQGGSSVRLDTKARNKDTFPHLWIETHQDGGSSPYSVEVFVVTSYVDDTMLPAKKEMLKSTAYDEAFGQGGRSDAFTVTFENQSYGIRVTGLPASATTCPKP